MLGFISYCLCLPDLDEVSRQLRAIREDPNLTFAEKFEKSREIFSKLTPGQGRQVFENDLKKMHYEANAEMQKFLKMSPEEQVAYLKEMEEERKKLGPKVAFAFGAPVKLGPGGADSGGAGGGMVTGVAGGPGGGKMFIGPPGGGPPGGGPGNPKQMQRTMLDNFSPETRAGQNYQKGLFK